MRLIDGEALYKNTAEWEAQALAQVERYNPIDSLEEWRRWSVVLKERSAFKFDVADAPTIVEFEGDINNVIVKGEEYHRIVRCKDCKYYKKTSDGISYCYDHDDDILWRDDDFCSRGETK